MSKVFHLSGVSKRKEREGHYPVIGYTLEFIILSTINLLNRNKV